MGTKDKVFDQDEVTSCLEDEEVTEERIDDEVTSCLEDE